MNHLNYTVLARATLASSINATELEITLTAGLGAGFPTGNCMVVVSDGDLTTDPTLEELAVGETIEVISRSSDVLTLRTRDVNGNASPLTHDTGDLVQILWTPADVTRLQEKMDDLEYLISVSLGSLTTGVRNIGPAYDNLKVVPQSSPNMTLKIKLGAGFVDRKTARLRADFTTPALVAPVSSTRHDLVSIDSATDLIVVTPGIEGELVKATPSGHIPLADITVIVSQSTIETGDIEDVRTDL